MQKQSAHLFPTRPLRRGEHINNTTAGTTEGLSLLDTQFVDSNTSLSILGNSCWDRKALASVPSTSVDNRSLPLSAGNGSNRSSSDKDENDSVHNSRTDESYQHAAGRDSQCQIQKQPAVLDCSSFVDPNSFSTPVLSSAASTFSNRVLSDLYTTPESHTFDTPDSPLNTPITPISPGLYAPKKECGASYSRYSLNDPDLERFVLSPGVFCLSLDDKIGKGSNAYVYSCQLSTVGIQNSSFCLAVKIPISRNKTKYIVQEANFAIKLRNYQDKWFKIHNSLYPFIDCYGLYYLNKDQFPLFKKNDELPCLLMKKMSLGLSTYIKTSEQAHETDTKLPLALWWKLCTTLLDALTILKALNCVHCDLKTDNIMALEIDDNDGGHHYHHHHQENILFKVIDFSSACELDKLVKCPDMTLQYTAPELLDFTKKPLPTFQSDLFSAGLVLLEAATGAQPYSSAGYDHFFLLTVIKEGRVLEWLSAEDSNVLKAHPDIDSVLRKILVERATLEDVIAHVDRMHA